MEQQRVIRRLLKKGYSLLPESDNSTQPNYCEESELTGSSGVSPSNSIPKINEILVDDDDTVMEISISVPNLSDIRNDSAKALMRSTSDNEEKEKLKNNIKMTERLAKKREKLLSMKRYSGYLKRPEILETVYSVEDPDDAGDNHIKMEEVIASNDKSKQEKTDSVETRKEDSLEIKEDHMFRSESGTTEYETDDESLRLFFSETDQSNCCSRRSSSGSQPSLLFVAPEDEISRSTEDLSNLKGKIKLVEKRRKMFQQKKSISLDCGEI